jgi:hypothetical protein
MVFIAVVDGGHAAVGGIGISIAVDLSGAAGVTTAAMGTIRTTVVTAGMAPE